MPDGVQSVSADVGVEVSLDGDVLYDGNHLTSDGDHGTVPVDITLYQSRKLTQNNGRAPERQVGKAMAAAFDAIDIDYNVWFGHDPLDPPAETPTSGGTFRWFEGKVENDNLPRVVDDCNMMLTNATGSGATIRESAVTNAGDITDERPLQVVAQRTDGQHQSVYACLHEMGHSLGFGPREKDNHWGDGWYDNQGRFVKTPCVGGADVEGACGQQIRGDGGRPVYLRLRFSSCAAGKIAERNPPNNDGYFHIGPDFP